MKSKSGETRKVKSLLWIMVVVGAVLLGGCGSSDNPTNKASVNANISNAPLAADANVNTSSANTSGETASSFEIPEKKSIENGKTETDYGITFTIPADWKPKKGSYGEYQSPGAESERMGIRISSGTETEKKERDLMSQFAKMREEKPTGKTRMRAVDGTIGILFVEEKYIDNRDFLAWWTFTDPDAEGKSENTYIQISCPGGKYEQYKQLMFDILHSVKLKK
ncbi:MAG: hypothetical protein WKF34_02215 [Pyrinomonadaceae bacterium]